jgi:hypothetical protein
MPSFLEQLYQKLFGWKFIAHFVYHQPAPSFTKVQQTIPKTHSYLLVFQTPLV